MTNQVQIVEYDSEWPTAFERQRDRIATACGPLVRAIEHMGSTSVPGLAAKPIIDLLIAAADPASLSTEGEPAADPARDEPIAPAGSEAHVRLARSIIELGFTYRGHNGLPERLFFHERSGVGGVHAHVVSADGWIWHDQLLFRDWLRSHPADARRYADLKRRLAALFHDDRVAYTNAKTEFVREIMLVAGGVAPWLRREAVASDRP